MLKHLIIAAIVTVFFGQVAHARDDKNFFSIEKALTSEAYEGRLNDDIKMFWGDQPHGKVVDSHGEFVTNKKTNSLGKSDRKACEWALLSALLSLQERAEKEGGNAVVNIRSYYKKKVFSSTEEFECHSGTFVTGVALKGEVVNLAE